MLTFLRRLFIGAPLATSRQDDERLPKVLALPIFASDALSSTAYATEEILLVLTGAGVAALQFSLPIACCIVALLVIVAISYTQTIYAYPAGGGSYTVTKENLGTVPGLTAAASLIIDYILTVAVSVAAGVAAIISAFPALEPYRVPLCLGCVFALILTNLRGLKESGILFALPSYLFIASALALVVTGIVKTVFLGVPPPNLSQGITEAATMEPLGLWMILRAFAGGCTAMTGTEAISNGVPAFKEPAPRNAAATLAWMAAILGVLFIGITWLATVYHVNAHPNDTETVLSKISDATFGRTVMYYIMQGATMLILILAANTSFVGFPRLGSILAYDRFLPRQLRNVGDRLVFSNGIIILGCLAAGLLVLFRGQTHALIPLYAVGVFLAFTLSQSGMVVRWAKLRNAGWLWRLLLNGVGAAATAVVVVVIATIKFSHGAWIVVLLIPSLVALFLAINRHYLKIGRQLAATQFRFTPLYHHTVICLVPGVHQGVLPALQYARSVSPDVRGLYVEIEPEYTQRVKENWERITPDIPLIILESPYRSLNGPVLAYLEEVKREQQKDAVTVVIPEFATNKWWHALLHNQSGLMLKIALMFRKDIVVTNVRYFLEADHR